MPSTNTLIFDHMQLQPPPPQPIMAPAANSTIADAARSYHQFITTRNAKWDVIIDGPERQQGCLHGWSVARIVAERCFLDACIAQLDNVCCTESTNDKKDPTPSGENRDADKIFYYVHEDFRNSLKVLTSHKTKKSAAKQTPQPNVQQSSSSSSSSPLSNIGGLVAGALKSLFHKHNDNDGRDRTRRWKKGAVENFWKEALDAQRAERSTAKLLRTLSVVNNDVDRAALYITPGEVHEILRTTYQTHLRDDLLKGHISQLCIIEKASDKVQNPSLFDTFPFGSVLSECRNDVQAMTNVRSIHLGSLSLSGDFIRSSYEQRQIHQDHWTELLSNATQLRELSLVDCQWSNAETVFSRVPQDSMQHVELLSLQNTCCLQRMQHVFLAVKLFCNVRTLVLYESFQPYHILHGKGANGDCFHDDVVAIIAWCMPRLNRLDLSMNERTSGEMASDEQQQQRCRTITNRIFHRTHYDDVRYRVLTKDERSPLFVRGEHTAQSMQASNSGSCSLSEAYSFHGRGFDHDSIHQQQQQQQRSEPFAALTHLRLIEMSYIFIPLPTATRNLTIPWLPATLRSLELGSSPQTSQRKFQSPHIAHGLRNIFAENNPTSANLSRNLKSLSIVNMTECFAYNDIKQILRCCGDSLEFLALVNCDGVNDRVLSDAIGRYCTEKLTHVDVSFCDNVSTTGIGLMALAAKALKSIGISGAKRVDVQTLRDMLGQTRETRRRNIVLIDDDV